MICTTLFVSCETGLHKQTIFVGDGAVAGVDLGECAVITHCITQCAPANRTNARNARQIQHRERAILLQHVGEAVRIVVIEFIEAEMQKAQMFVGGQRIGQLTQGSTVKPTI